MYELIGYEVKEGIKKATGKPYKIEILHCVGAPIAESKNAYGRAVECIVINLLITGDEPQYPVLGDKVRVYYGRTGYPTGYDIV